MYIDKYQLKKQKLENGAFIDKYGCKTSKKLEKIKKAAWEWANDGGSWSRKAESQKLFNFRMRFEKEAERIGGVNYTFGDCLA